MFDSWLAGFIDGEGTITFQAQRERGNLDRRRLYPRIIVAQADRGVLDEIRGEVGFGNVLKNGYENHTWQVNAPDQVEAVIVRVLPHLRIKRPQAEAMIEFFNCRRPLPRTRPIAPYDEHCWELFNSVRHLNLKARHRRLAVA